MEDQAASMQRFFSACDDLMTSKHILADKKIGELLRAVAVNDDLMGLFQAVTKDFDYRAAKHAYLRAPEDSHTARGEVYLPADEAELLAFVFCLLAEFDSGTLRFNDFLLRYFYEDGSYTASYALFLERMIRPFRDILRRCFPHPERMGVSLYSDRTDGIYSALAANVNAERERLKQLPLSQEDAVAGDSILYALYSAVQRKDIAEIKAHKASDALKAPFLQKVQRRIESIWSAEDGEIFDNLYMKTDITSPGAVAEAISYVHS